MPRVWRRLAIVVATITLAVLLISLGVAVWLYSSGRLATVTSDFVQRLSGQQVTIGVNGGMVEQDRLVHAHGH